jgi:hypothetical protein
MRATRLLRLAIPCRSLLGLALTAIVLHPLAAQSPRDATLAAPQARTDSLLRLGDHFPPLVGTALSGRRIGLPDTASARATMVAFGFSRTGGNDATRWDDRLASDTSGHARVDVVVVAELGGAPRIMRGLITAGIRRGASPSARDRMLVLDRDDALWKRRLGVTTTDRSYVVLIAPNGRIAWMSDGAFDESRYARLRAALP